MRHFSFQPALARARIRPSDTQTFPTAEGDVVSIRLPHLYRHLAILSRLATTFT